MTNPKVPKIKDGGIPLPFLVTGGIVLICVAVIAFSAIIKSKKGSDGQSETVREEIMRQGGLDPDFFAIAVEEPEPEPEPEPKPKPKPRPMPKPAPPPPPKDLTAADLFSAEQPKQIAEEKSGEASAVNFSRRKAWAIRTHTKNLRTSELEQPQLSQEKWNEPRSRASLPVDLSRTLPVGRMISAILVNEINSEKGGIVRAQVERHVYAAHGRNILIPAGSVAVGRYQPASKVGQETLQILWARIITPKGINIHTGNAEMTDAMGRAGIRGEVDRRYFEKFGTSLLVSTLAVVASHTIDVDSESQGVALEKFGDSIINTSRAIMEDNLDIKPRIEIAAGSRIQIVPTQDIFFQKPKARQAQAIPSEALK